jgi:hypothetical protein
VRGRGAKRARFWTRERVLLGMQRFYKEFGFCPTDQGKYAEHQQFTGRHPLTGKRSNLGWHQKYPSSNTILGYFATMREAWTAAGFDIDRTNEEWTQMEDWFVLESVGILFREEVAKILKRTAPAIKRRLYDLGDIRSYNRWGITLNKAAQLMKLTDALFRKYIDCGIIPFFRGCRLIYLNPADLLKIEEFDWSAADINPELDRVVRAAVAQRICKMLKFGQAWRDHEIYKIQKTRERYTGRIRNPRKSVFVKDYPAMPADLDIGDWVRTTGPCRSMQTEVGKRFGRIETIYYSWQRVKRYDGTLRATWVAMVEFPKIRTITGQKDDRIRYAIPLDMLQRVEEPKPTPKPPSMHPIAIKGRERIARGEYTARQKRIRERVESFKADLT